ncbi:MAG: sigma 54-interacting transcriptional regulator [Magnetococcales bacterium]|nr:sigma 54-interacting transcriptional regulator [Magnetococcales bacterium]
MSPSPPQSFINLLREQPNPAILVDQEYRILASNDPYRECFGAVTALGVSRCYEVSHGFNRPCDQEGESCPFQKSIVSGKPQRDLHVHHTTHGPEYVNVEIIPLTDKSNNILFFLEIIAPLQIASATAAPGGMVGASSAFKTMLHLVNRVAKSDTNVLLTGESGTGKEVIARAIHAFSHCSSGPFVPVECSGLSDQLFETELFGHERGAFTGAHVEKTGLVEVAHKGTLFLDEIGDVSLPLQVKLLRLLETRIFRRVGGIDSRHSDFRLICATNRDLESMVKEGSFRLDLYYRIQVFPITLPPLRQRKEDLPILIDSLLKRLHPKRSIRVSPQALEQLKAHDYPGNVRELQNILERACLMMDGDLLLPEHLPCIGATPPPSGTPRIGFMCDYILPLQEVEWHYIRHVVNNFSLEKNIMAARLGISPRTLYRRLEESWPDDKGPRNLKTSPMAECDVEERSPLENLPGWTHDLPS